MQHTELVATVVQGIVVIPILMEDEPVHTEFNGFECSDLECICHDEQAGRNTAQDRNATTQLPDGSWW